VSIKIRKGLLKKGCLAKAGSSPVGIAQEGMREELYNAPNYGYNFEILWGYTFKKRIYF
jgi:hypothetical protein